jgi:hypothetical protein
MDIKIQLQERHGLLATGILLASPLGFKIFGNLDALRWFKI